MIKAASYIKKTTITAAIAILIAVSVLFTESTCVSAAANSLPSNESTGISYTIYECDTKQTLLKQNAELPADCSLLARLMTCLLVLENPSVSVTDFISPSQDSVSASGRYKLNAAGNYMVDHLLKSVILCNADNAANLLASHVNPNTAYFVSMMNQKAQDLGMGHTFFKNADGADDPFQQTTAYDMALFWAYAMSNAQFRKIASNESVHIWTGTAVVNECKLVAERETFSGALTKSGAYAVYDAANGLGTTMFYLENKVSDKAPAVKLVFILSGGSDDSASDLGKNYVNNVLTNFKKTALISKGEFVVSAEIGGSELRLNAAETSYCMIPIDMTGYVENISYSVIDKNTSAVPGKALSLNELSPPIEEGAVIGTANYLLKDGSVHKVGLIAGNSIHSDSKTINTFYKLIKENTDIFILISVLVLCELILAFCILLNKVRRRKIRP